MFGRGSGVDRFAADHPWWFGLVGALVMGPLLVGISWLLAEVGSLLGDPIRWSNAAVYTAIFAGTCIAIGYGRRRALATGRR